MRKYSHTSALMILALLGLVGGCNAAPDHNGPGYFEGEDLLGESRQPIVYNGSDYLFVVSPRVWSQAKINCELNGYNLVKIDDDAEESFLHSEQMRHGG